MIPTFSCAPLKNSGFRSIGMSSVALLILSNSEPAGVKRFTFSGILSCDRPHNRQQATGPTRQRQVNIAGSPQTKKAAHFRVLQLVQLRLPPAAGGWKIEVLDSNHRGDTLRAFRSP